MSSAAPTRQTQRASRWLITLALCVSLAGCSHPAASTPNPPKSPQEVSIDLCRTIVDLADTTVKTAIALRQAGKIGSDDERVILDWTEFTVKLESQVRTELASADPWPTQRIKIAVILAERSIPKVGENLNPEMQGALTSLLLLLNQLEEQVK